MAEPRFIRLTMAVPETDPNDYYVFINPSLICAMHSETAAPSRTWISMLGGATRLVRESPEEIAQLIRRGEAKRRKTRQRASD